MTDFAVQTHTLRAAAGDLMSLAKAAHDLADGHVRAARLVPALGLDEPAQAADAFLNSWAYGIRWIAAQSEQLARDLRHSADTVELMEAQLARAAAGGDPTEATAVLSAPPATLVEPPLPMVRHWTGVLAPPMQLAQAARADQLIPGDPEQVRLLQSLVENYAQAAYDARWLMDPRSLAEWKGAAADAARAELDQIRERFVKAEEAFDHAQGALTGYYTVHADAQWEAGQAIKLWQSAILASQVARGVAVGPAPPEAPADPDAVLARAGAMARDAEDRLKLAGRTLAEVLHEATEGAPKDPGFWAHVRRAVASFGKGLVEGTVVEPVEGAVGISKLVIALNPVRAIYDPQGYAAAQEALYAGIWHVATHPGEFGAEIIDVKGWKEDRWETFGKFLPDLLAIGAAGRGMGLFKEAESLDQVSSAGTEVEAIKAANHGHFEFPKLSRALARQKVADLGLDPATDIGEAVRGQLSPPFGSPDVWHATHLRQGQLIAVVDGWKKAMPFEGALTTDGAQFHEALQMFAKRQMVDGVPGDPLVDGSVKIYRVTSPDGLAAARSIAEANPQFGAGGATQLFIPRPGEAVRDGLLDEIGTHDFDPATLRSLYEDPAYRTINPDLPVRALDPGHEKIVGYIEGVREKGFETVRENAASTVGAAAIRAVDGSDSDR